MRVLLAFDKFKGSLTAREACDATAKAIRETHPDWQIDSCPVTDGGDGFTQVLTTAAGGTFRKATVTGPRGQPADAQFGFLPSRHTAIAEMASASGLALLTEAERDPWLTTSRGTGELLAAGFADGATSILLGIGGSATNDLGLGALAAFGLTAQDEHGKPAALVPSQWSFIARFSGKPDLAGVRIACDVKNPLLGRQGAAASYGPQKGLRAEDVRRMDHAAARIALMLCHHFGKPESLIDAPGAGAAGGLGFGLSLAGASLTPGFDLVSEWLELDRRVEAADLVITGEGAFDETSYAGKATGALAELARSHDKPVVVLAGDVSRAPERDGVKVQTINPGGREPAESMRRAGDLLAAAARRV